MSQEYRSREERRKQNQNNNGNKNGKKKGKGSIAKKIFVTIFIIGIIGLIAGAITVFAIISDAPELKPEALQTPQASILLDKDGNEFGTFAKQNRIKMDIKDVPDSVKEAFIATEDARFMEHFGVDIQGIGRAVVANFTEGFGSEGASTITQQVVKNTMLTNEKRLERKIKEAYLAIKLEQRYSKNQILGMYLNTIYYGNGAYGVATAAETYFGLDPEEIDKIRLDQAALLAAMVKAPTHYDPYSKPEQAEERRNLVLSLMEEQGYISKDQMKEAQKVPIEKTIVELSASTKQYKDFMARVMDEVMELGNFEDRNEIYTSGLTIYTTLDPKVQDVVEEVLKPENKYGIKYPDEYFQPGLVIVDPKTGAVRAIGSGQDSNDFASTYATDIRRQPGSSIKPILDYGPAIEYLKWPTYHQVDNSKLVIDEHQIKNWSSAAKYNQNNVSMRFALQWSLNIPAVRTFMEVGRDKAVEFATSLGMPTEDEPYYPTSAIGGFKYGVSPLQMAGAYAAFANEGIYNAPYTVTKIEFPDGKKIERKKDPEAVMHDYTAYMITDMLKDVINQGTGGSTRISGLPMAGKTGTTNYTDEDIAKYGFKPNATKDSWMVGYTTNYSMAVWTGKTNKDGKPQYLDPSKDEDDIAKTIYKVVMKEIHKGIETPDFVQPDSVIDVALEKDTGLLASEFTPKDQIYYELAVKGTDLPDVSDKYFKLDPVQNLQAVYDESINKIQISWEYPFDNNNSNNGNGKAKGKDKNKKNKNTEATGNIQFKVFVSVDEGSYQELITTKNAAILVPEPIPGAVYKFKVIAIDSELNKESEPVETSVQIPKQEDTTIPDPFDGDDGGDNGGNDGGNDGGTGEGDGGNGDGGGDDGGDGGIIPGLGL